MQEYNIYDVSVNNASVIIAGSERAFRDKIFKMRYFICKALIFIWIILIQIQSFNLSKYKYYTNLVKIRQLITNIYNVNNEEKTGNYIIDYRSVKGIDNRESLPYVVVEIGTSKQQQQQQQQKEIGTYLLDSSTSCGDILELGDKGVFKVKRVRYLYKYESGKFRVFKKKLDATLVKSSLLNEQSGYDVKDILQ